LDCFIAQLTEARNLLFTFASAGDGVSARPLGAPVQTFEQELVSLDADLAGKLKAAEAAANTRKFQKHRRKVLKLEKQKRGGRRSSKTQAPSTREIPSAKAAEPVVTRAGAPTGKAGTVAGAMKLEIASYAGREFSVGEVRTALETKYAEEQWWKNAGDTAVAGNLSYWVKVGRLAKTDGGYQAKDMEWFKDVLY